MPRSIGYLRILQQISGKIWSISHVKTNGYLPAKNKHDGGVNNLVRATLNETILAESDQTIMVEGNHDFPPDSVNQQYFRPSDSHTMCGWRGLASYYDVEVEGEKNGNAAWYYESPRPAAKKIAGYVAFWHGVKVNEG